MSSEDKVLVLSLTLSKALAVDRTNLELAVLASFFSSLAANLGVIIQNRNLYNQTTMTTNPTQKNKKTENEVEDEELEL